MGGSCPAAVIEVRDVCADAYSAYACGMPISEFLARLESYLATRLAALDPKDHPSSNSARRLTRQWTLEFIASEAAKHPAFENLAALLHNVSDPGPEFD